jgi:hypothetical protein
VLLLLLDRLHRVGQVERIALCLPRFDQRDQKVEPVARERVVFARITPSTSLRVRRSSRWVRIGSISMSFNEAAAISPRKSFISCHAASLRRFTETAADGPQQSIFQI